MKITLFIPCFIDQIYPEAGISTVHILEKLGHQVDFAAGAVCCGQPAFNSGFWDEARDVAERTLDALDGAEVIVLPSGSCTAMFRNFYPRLFEGRRGIARARRVASRCFELAEFLVHKLEVTELGARFPAKVTVHDGCHEMRELHRKEAPRKLLAEVKGLEIIEMQERETCCGFGGTFAMKFPMISGAMAEVKCESALETGAEYIVSTDTSCLMQIQGFADRKKMPLKTIHIAQVLDSR